MTTPATETKSIGLPADARSCQGFCSSTYNPHRDKTQFDHLPGLAKTSPALTRTATNYTAGPLAFMPVIDWETFPIKLEKYRIIGISTNANF
jgi:hypothetical protein